MILTAGRGEFGHSERGDERFPLPRPALVVSIRPLRCPQAERPRRVPRDGTLPELLLAEFPPKYSLKVGELFGGDMIPVEGLSVRTGEVARGKEVSEEGLGCLHGLKSYTLGTSGLCCCSGRLLAPVVPCSVLGEACRPTSQERTEYATSSRKGNRRTPRGGKISAGCFPRIRAGCDGSTGMGVEHVWSASLGQLLDVKASQAAPSLFRVQSDETRLGHTAASANQSEPVLS